MLCRLHDVIAVVSFFNMTMPDFIHLGSLQIIFSSSLSPHYHGRHSVWTFAPSSISRACLNNGYANVKNVLPMLQLVAALQQVWNNLPQNDL
jgi:hypothetical protein